MNKTEYVTKLTNELGHMPYGDVKDIIQSIEEHFDEGISLGRSEDEIAASLGDPKELAAEFKDGVKLKQIMKKRKMSDNFKGPDGRGRIFVIVFNAFVGIECWLILLFAIIAAFCCLAADLAFIGLIVGAVIGIVLMTRKKKGGKEHMPFGPSLCIGLVAASLVGNQIIDWYVNIIKNAMPNTFGK